MKLTGLFRSKCQQQTSANIAKERLKIIVAHQRLKRSNTDYIPELKQKLLDLVLNYVHIDEKSINVNLYDKDNSSILEIIVQLPFKLE